MPSSFDPKRVLRQVSNSLLDDLFQTHGHEVELPWDELGQTQVDPIFDAWQALPDADRCAIEIVLQEVNEMATEDGVRAIIEEAIRQDNGELIDDLEGYASRYDKAVWTYIKARDVWEVAVRFARADSLSRGRYWIKRVDIPAKEPDVRPEKIEELQAGLSAFFLNTQARGRICRIEHYVRASGVDYFFAYLDDYADTYVNFDDHGEFVRTPERRAFEVVFVYNRHDGALEMYARGGKRVNGPLQEIFCRVILGEELGPEDRDSHPYELNVLLNRHVEFPTDPEDGIASVRVRKLRLTIKGMPRRRITLEADPDAGPDDIYEMMEKYLDESRLPTAVLNVTQVGFKFAFAPREGERQSSLSFEVSHPNSSNLKSKPERLREIGEKYLRRWEIDRAGTVEDSLAVA
jgi:hypothetical protein